MKARIVRNSGAGGQISPLLIGRDDLAKQQTSDRKIERFIVLPEGARMRTPGTRYMGTLRNEARPVRFIDFDAGGGDTYMLAFNDGKMRVYADDLVYSGPSIYEIDHPFTDDQLETIAAAQSIDVLFMATGGVPKRLTRYSDVNWVLDDYPYVEGPVRIQNTNKTIKIGVSATTGTITVTATGGSIFQAGHVGSVWKVDEVDFSDPPEWKAIAPVGLGNRVRYKGRIYECVALNVGAPPGDSGPNPPVHDDGDFVGGVGNVTWRYLSDVSGYFRITGFTSGTVVTAEVIKTLPASLTSKPSYRWFEAAWSDVRGWPTSVSIVDQSLVWAKGNTGWTTRASDIYSFVIDTDDDSGVEFSLNSPDGKRTDIQWILPTGVIVAGSSSSEWVIRGASNAYDRLKPDNTRAIQQGSKGSVRHTPALVEGGAVFIGRSRQKLIFVKFDAVTEQVAFTEFTTYSREMLRGLARQVVAQIDPYNVLFVRDALGSLIAVTFQPDQDVIGWAAQPMKNGKVIQIGVKQASDESRTELWLCVERVIDGLIRRYIEVMQPYFKPADEANPTAAGAWFVDCGKLYSGAATATITGADHLEGQEVAVFCNGQEFARKTVIAGGFVLERPMTGVLYGIPVRAAIKSLPFDTQTPAGSTRGANKTANRVHLHVHESVGGTISANSGQPSDLTFTAGLPFSTPLPLKTGLLRVTTNPITDLELTLDLVCDNALPFTLLGWMPDADIKDP